MEKALPLTLVGLTIVFCVLLLIATVITFIRYLDNWFRLRAEAAPIKEAAPVLPTIDDTTLVLISAAVATVLQGRYRIRKIRKILPLNSQRDSWSRQGRAVLQGSHVIDKKKN
jgi:Na+-transporting methylmalonyl-CoA/oxaloacetate decarboxylase gamma subunit